MKVPAILKASLEQTAAESLRQCGFFVPVVWAQLRHFFGGMTVGKYNTRSRGISGGWPLFGLRVSPATQLMGGNLSNKQEASYATKCILYRR